MLPTIPKRWSVKALFLVMTLVAVTLAWWRHDPFQEAVHSVRRQGGAVSYNDRKVLVSIGRPTMPSGASDTWTRLDGLNGLPDPNFDPSVLYDDFRRLAQHRESLQVEFRTDAQALAAKKHFESTLSSSQWKINLEVRRPGWSLFRLRRK